EEKGNQSHQGHRIDTSPFGMAEKTGGAERHAPVLNALERFLERMGDEPEHAADFAQKIASNLTDFLSNHNGRISVRHVQSKLPYFARWKRTKLMWQSKLARCEIVLDSQLLLRHRAI